MMFLWVKNIDMSEEIKYFQYLNSVLIFWYLSLTASTKMSQIAPELDHISLPTSRKYLLIISFIIAQLFVCLIGQQFFCSARWSALSTSPCWQMDILLLRRKRQPVRMLFQGFQQNRKPVGKDRKHTVTSIKLYFYIIQNTRNMNIRSYAKKKTYSIIITAKTK